MSIDTPRPGATLDELRLYAERVSQEFSMATVIVAVDGGQHEYVVTPSTLGDYHDVVIGALIGALRQRVGQAVTPLEDHSDMSR